MAVRIYADFNNQNLKGFPRLNCVGSLESIRALNLKLSSGMPVTLFEEDFEVSATLEFDADEGVWVGIPDWKTIRYFK